MKALLLAAGLGTRLKPFTFFQAKATLPLLDVPFIHYPLQYLRAQGVSEVVINLHAHPDTVMAAAGNEFCGMRICYSHEPEILGTAGAMRKARGLLGDKPFAVLNSDMLCNIPLREMSRQHDSTGSLVTLAVMDGARFPRYSGLYFEESVNPPALSGFSGGGKKYHYTGVQIVSPQILDHIADDRKSEIFRDVYPAMLGARQITGYKYDGIWLEIGTLKDYLHTSLELLRSPLPEWLRPPGMGDATVSRRASVSVDAVVEESVVMDNAVIQPGAVVRRSIIGRDVTVAGEVNGVALARGISPWWI